MVLLTFQITRTHFPVYFLKVDEEKARLAEQSQRLKSDFDERKSAYEVTLRQTLSHAGTNHDQEMNELKAKHQVSAPF